MPQSELNILTEILTDVPSLNANHYLQMNVKFALFTITGPGKRKMLYNMISFLNMKLKCCFHLHLIHLKNGDLEFPGKTEDMDKDGTSKYVVT